MIPLRADELARIFHTFGERAIEFKLTKAYIRKPYSGSRCIFQYRIQGRWLCILQEMGMKPVACKLWPFIPLIKPKYGRDKEAVFEHLGERFYIYVDPRCPGVTLGWPSSHLLQKVLPEVIELRLGIRTKQRFTTSSIRRKVQEQTLPVPSNIIIYQQEMELIKQKGLPDNLTFQKVSQSQLYH